MNTFSPHIPFEKLVDLADERPVGEAPASMAHISACSRCTTELQQLRQVVTLMRTDTSEDAPADILAYARNMFRERATARELPILRRIVAALSFDSLKVAPTFGVRSTSASFRQLLYSVESSDIDLRITSDNDQWVVAGQVLGQDCGGGEVTLEGERESVVAAVNELCEFNLPPVAAGSYKLFLRLPGVEVEIPQLELQGVDEYGATRKSRD